MMAFLRLRVWVTLVLGLAAAGLGYCWPASPRAVLRCEHVWQHFAFSEDSTMLAVIDLDPDGNVPGKILVWDVATGERLHRLDIGKEPFPSRVVFGPDGTSVGVVASGAITKRHLGTGRLLARYDHASWSHDPDHDVDILFSATGCWLAHDTFEGRIYDVETGEIVQDYHERWPDRSRSGYGGHVVALVKDEVKIFDVFSGAEVGTFATAVVRAPMVKMWWTISADGTHGVYFARTDEWVVYNSVSGQQCVLPIDGMSDCSFSRDNRLVAVASYRKDRNPLDSLRNRLRDSRRSVQVFDTTTGARVGSSIRDGHRCGFAPDGKTLAVASEDNIALWDWPAPARWPLLLALPVPTMALSYGVGWWWSRQRPVQAIG